MRNFPLPDTVTPVLLDKVLRDILKLKPFKERAIRLRLEGMTLEQIAERLNEEYGTDENPFYKMRVCRICEGTESRLLRWIKKNEFANSLSGPDGVVMAADTVRDCLWRLGDSKPHRPRPRSAGGVLLRPEPVYVCLYCGEKEWTERFQNRGGHANHKVYICVNCNSEVSPQQRRDNSPMTRPRP